MQPRKHLLATCSVLLMAVLLAACAAPAAAPSATPVPPTPTPIPPTPPPMPPETAAPDPVAVVQAWHAALNNGDLDGALALMTEDATISGWRPPVRGVLDWWIDIKTHFGVQDCQQDGEQLACDVIMTDDASYRIWDDEATGADQMRSMFDWLAGKETQYQIADCVWDGFGVACSMSVVDGCIAAFGAPDGLPGTMSFYPLEDGTLRRVVGLLDLSGRQSYGDWLEAEAAWASANRAAELAQAEGYSQEAGAMAVKLCQEYAETLK